MNNSRNFNLLQAVALTIFPFLAGCGEQATTPVTEKTVPKEDKPKILRVVEDRLEVQGKGTPVFKILNENGEQGWFGKEGERFFVDLRNETTVPITVHWHGMILPNSQDGVPYVTQAPIPPGESQVYDFETVQSGTYWMHSHFGLQEQPLMAAPLIIRSADDDPPHDREILVILNDITFQNPKKIFEALISGFDEDKLKASEVYVNLEPVPANISREAAMNELGRKFINTGAEADKSKTAPVMTMSGLMDINDVAYNAFTANRTTLNDPDVFDVKAGETVLVRIINASSGTNFYVGTEKLTANLVATDGEPVVPLPGQVFEISIAQRLDLLIDIPETGGPYPIFFQGEGTKLLAGIILKPEGTKPMVMSSLADKTTMPFGITQSLLLKAKNPLPKKKVDRKLDAVLGGDMSKYTWTINGKRWPDIDPLKVKEGERVEINMINKTGMGHPMHLHGHVFQVTEINGTAIDGPMRDTVMVPPNGNVKIQFDANNPGYWAFHCHILYHLAAGMFTIVQYDGYDQPAYRPQDSKNEVAESIPSLWYKATTTGTKTP